MRMQNKKLISHQRLANNGPLVVFGDCKKRDAPVIYHLRDGPLQDTGPPVGTGPPEGTGPPKILGNRPEMILRKNITKGKKLVLKWFKTSEEKNINFNMRKTKMKNFKLKRLLSLAFIGCLSTLGAPTVFAAAGVTIGNIASLTYDVGGVPTTLNSLSADFVEDRLVNFTVAESGGLTTSVVAGATSQVQTFTVTNNGNGTQDFLLTAVDAASGAVTVHGAGVTDAFDAEPLSINVFVEDGTNPGTYEVLEDTAIFIDDLSSIAPNNFVTVYVVADIPVGATAGQVAALSLVAQVAVGGVAGEGAAIMNDNNGNFSPSGVFSNTGTTTTEDAAQAATDDITDTATEEIVFNDPAGDLNSNGGADVAQDGQASVYDSYTVGVAILTVTKTSEVIWDPINGGLTEVAGNNPKAIPGAYVQYTVTVANDATAVVSGFLTSLSDSLAAAGTSLDPNLLLSSAGTTIAIPADYENGVALDAIRINTADTTGRDILETNAAGTGTSFTNYCTGDAADADADGCAYAASVIDIDLAAYEAMNAEAGYLAGELKPNESVVIVFNVILP